MVSNIIYYSLTINNAKNLTFHFLNGKSYRTFCTVASITMMPFPHKRVMHIGNQTNNVHIPRYNVYPVSLKIGVIIVLHHKSLKASLVVSAATCA